MKHRVLLRPTGLLLVTLMVAALAACGRDAGSAGMPSAGELDDACAAVPGCGDAIPVTATPTETIWRVEVIRGADGTPRFGQTEAILVTQGTGVPVSSMEGPYMLIGLDAAGEAVDGQYLDFPTELRMEGVDDDGLGFAVFQSLEGLETSTIGYVRALPGIGRLIVADGEGREVASSPAPSQVAVRIQPSPPRLAGAWTPFLATAYASGSGQQGWFQAPAHCGHVLLLDGERDWAWAQSMAYRESLDLIVPGPTQRAVLRGALEMATPLLCHSVARVAFATPVAGSTETDGIGGAVNISNGDMMVLNAEIYPEEELATSRELRLRLMQTILHEAAHSAENLLNAQSDRPGEYRGGWRPPARSLAGETIDRVRLRKSLRSEWVRVHDSFVKQGWAKSHAGRPGGLPSPERREAVRNWSPEQTARAGVISRYGGTYYADDIADMVGWLYLAPHFRAAGIPEGKRQTEDYGCQVMRREPGPRLPADLAAFYTKVHFLEDLGLVREEDVRACTGSVDIGANIGSQGFHFSTNGSRNVFGTGVKAHLGRQSKGGAGFEMSAEGRADFGGRSYPAKAILRLELDTRAEVALRKTTIEQVAWPRGVYPLGILGLGSGEFQLRLDGMPAGNFDVMDGYALVSEASNQRIAGSIFVSKALRVHAPLPVPQVFDEPLLIRFLIER